jgi:hypothetical protein
MRAVVGAFSSLGGFAMALVGKKKPPGNGGKGRHSTERMTRSPSISSFNVDAWAKFILFNIYQVDKLLSIFRITLARLPALVPLALLFFPPIGGPFR